jgi:hypothetical protein
MENKKIVIWQLFYIFEIDLANKIKFNLFPNCIIKRREDIHSLNKDDINIAIYSHFFHENSKDPVEDLSWADLIIHYTNEIIIGPWDSYEKKIIKSFNNKKFITIASGHRNCYDYPTDRAYLHLQHFFSTLSNYCHHVDYTLPKTKDKYFDILLGTARNHRTFIIENIIKNKIEDKCLINMTKDIYNNYGYNYRSTELHQYEDPAAIPQTTAPGEGSMITIKGMKNGYNLSQSIPNKIYNNAWYSIVSETNPSNSTFFSEKTAKCLFAKRVFVFFGSCGQLKILKEQGYKTFGDVIDESYDDVKDNVKRWSSAFEQMLKLIKQDPVEIYNRLDDVLEHNKNLVCDQLKRLNKLQNFITKHINDAEK